jgi:O-antigen/teichoic acid export membrane protein
MLGREAVAVYNVAYKLFEPSLILPSVLLAATFPLISQAGGAGGKPGELRQVLGHTLLLLCALGAGAALLLALLSAPLVGLLYGGAYSASAAVLQVLSLACLPMFANYGLTHALIAVDRPRLYALFTLAAMLANIGVNLLLIPLWGVSGAAAATVAAEVVLFALCAAAILRLLSPSAEGRRTAHVAHTVEVAPERGAEGTP